jgi:hypothetical protein
MGGGAVRNEEGKKKESAKIRQEGKIELRDNEGQMKQKKKKSKIKEEREQKSPCPRHVGIQQE